MAHSAGEMLTLTPLGEGERTALVPWTDGLHLGELVAPPDPLGDGGTPGDGHTVPDYRSCLLLIHVTVRAAE